MNNSINTISYCSNLYCIEKFYNLQNFYEVNNKKTNNYITIIYHSYTMSI